MDQIERLCPDSCNYIDIGIGVAQYCVLNITKFVTLYIEFLRFEFKFYTEAMIKRKHTDYAQLNIILSQARMLCFFTSGLHFGGKMCNIMLQIPSYLVWVHFI